MYWSTLTKYGICPGETFTKYGFPLVVNLPSMGFPLVVNLPSMGVPLWYIYQVWGFPYDTLTKYGVSPMVHLPSMGFPWWYTYQVWDFPYGTLTKYGVPLVVHLPSMGFPLWYTYQVWGSPGGTLTKYGVSPMVHLPSMGFPLVGNDPIDKGCEWSAVTIINVSSRLTSSSVLLTASSNASVSSRASRALLAWCPWSIRAPKHIKKRKVRRSFRKHYWGVEAFRVGTQILIFRWRKTPRLCKSSERYHSYMVKYYLLKI